MAEYQCIQYQPGRVARVRLNRPRYRNAQSRILLEELESAPKSCLSIYLPRVKIASLAWGQNRLTLYSLIPMLAITI